ncbi:MAG: L-seryl-tRNA(Sec) selenium transferase [Myxococcales bacterium]|nr:L-seryl-tRNA(Sec) selenium transferase [Myxococcales bacterium]
MEDSDRANAALRHVPKVDALALHSDLAEARRALGESRLVVLARDVAAEVRREVLAGGVAPSIDACAERVNDRVRVLLQQRIRRVINATGVVLHTNLGRAPLSRDAVAATLSAARGYEALEVSLAGGKRGGRGAFAERALALLTGAEAALVVNNNAAAVLLALAGLGRGRGVVVSRGELVEIGGGFRVPDVMASSGARLIEVGTTNRTRIADYERALDEHEDADILLRVHPGNFRQTGFVESAERRELARLAVARGKLFIEDLGGGALIDLEAYAGLAGEPVARECIREGAMLVCFSADKVLGGPQAGAIVGRGTLVEKLRRDPLARALRLGPLPMAALEATLASYLAGDFEAIPVLAMLRTPVASVHARVVRWCAALARAGVPAEAVEVDGRVGGGTFADHPLASVAAELRVASAAEFTERLRTGEPAVLPRIHEGRVLLDGRTVLPCEDDELCDAVVRAYRT